MDDGGRFESSFLRGLEERSQRFGRHYRTGWSGLDDLTGGVQGGQLWVVTGPEELRRAVTGCLALWAACDGAATGLVGLQDTLERLQLRSLVAATGLPPDRLTGAREGWAGAQRRALDEAFRGVVLHTMTAGSLVPSHQANRQQFDLLVLDDPYGEMVALASTFSFGPGWSDGASPESPLRTFIARSRAAVVVSAPATKVARWKPHLRIDIAEPARPWSVVEARVRRPGHDDAVLELPFALGPGGIVRLPQPAPVGADGARPPLHPLERLHDRAAELWAQSEPGVDLGPRGECPECGSRDVVHHLWGMPPPWLTEVEWVRLGGCVLGPDDDPADRYVCGFCEHVWGPD